MNAVFLNFHTKCLETSQKIQRMGHKRDESKVYFYLIYTTILEITDLFINYLFNMDLFNIPELMKKCSKTVSFYFSFQYIPVSSSKRSKYNKQGNLN